MKVDFKLLAIGILVVIILFNNAFKCGENSKGLENDTISSSTKIDTSFGDTIRIIHDTIFIKVTEIEIKHDTIFTNNGNIITIENSTQYEDSLIFAEIKTYSKCVADSIKFKYSPKFPIYITKFITKETETILEKKNKFQIYAGFTVGGSTNSFKFGPIIHLKTRRDNIISFGYDVSRNEIEFGYAFKISVKSKK